MCYKLHLQTKVFERLGTIFEEKEDGTQCNPFMALYKTMHEVEQQQKAAAEERGEAYTPNVKMYIDRVREGQHPGCYNDCQKGDIAAVFVSKDEQPPKDFKVCVHSRNTGEPFIFDVAARNENTVPMCYPLLFPHGDKGNYRCAF